MSTWAYDPLRIRKMLGRDRWLPPRALGEDGFGGWVFDTADGDTLPTRIIVTLSPVPGGNPLEEWVHASISHPHLTPSYEELATLHLVVFGDDGWSYQVFAPRSEHVNIHEHALHLWGRPEGQRMLPNFGAYGTI